MDKRRKRLRKVRMALTSPFVIRLRQIMAEDESSYLDEQDKAVVKSMTE